MGRLDSAFIDKIADSSIKLYNELLKTGKPIESEWTVLSCIAQYDNKAEEFEVASLGTGSKCIGASKMSASGDILNDSHAEVFARRGFLIYLYENIELALDSKKSIFNFENGLFKVKDNIEFIYYSSQLPCGDASILPKAGEEEHYGDVLQSLKKQASEDICGVDYKKTKTDIYRTGAKCLPDLDQDSKQSGEGYHILGQVRTKPGRGDRTQSVSCSDKMARWIHVGIQGALLDLLLSKPIFIKHFIFGAGVPYSEESLQRALLKRSTDDLSVVQPGVIPGFYQSKLVFPHIRTEKNIRPAPGSIVWTKSKGVEVAVQGRKLGVTKKKIKSLSSSLYISKYNIYKTFQSVMSRESMKKLIAIENLHNVPYVVMKRKSKRYLEQWELVKDIFFKSWTKKPDMWNFCIQKT